MNVGGILLTGGTSRRLGVDKATLLLDGIPLAQRAADALRARCPVLVEVGPGHSDLRAVREEPPGSGPLAALVAGADALVEADVDAVVLLACDLPNVGPALDALLVAAPAALVVPVDGSGRAQYTCARYGGELVARARDLVAAGERSLRALAATAHGVDVIEVDGLAPEVLADIDTPADARRWGVQAPR
jgi:molybdopterin-guanine dinucleotide biosynthesis protein A